MSLDVRNIVFIDTEVDPGSRKVLDIGAVTGDGKEFHSKSLPAFADFIRGYPYICGHNILKHDMKYLQTSADGAKHSIDTLYLSPLLFPKKPYHKLVKDDKLASDERNNPLNDSKKARDLLHDEITAFHTLDKRLQHIYYGLLKDTPEFKDFFGFIGYESTTGNIGSVIRETFSGTICAHAPVEKLLQKYPIELAYALAIIHVIQHDSISPPWVLKNYPRTENVLRRLRNQKCRSCAYCDESLDEIKALKRFFDYNEFRKYDGVPLQHSAVKAAVDGKSILAVFPTGGGKSITFQLPALMAGVNEKGLTVVISPLQSLMKDQTDNLEIKHSITEAVTINGSLDPLDRAKAFERVENGSASILYISPESLRSNSIERLLLSRNVVRFVIDEAHCFSSWGQDFRVDYLYIGEFIRRLQERKEMPQNIPVSCFTATAKQRVIADIQDYFRQFLSLELDVFRASAARVNLIYHIFAEDDPDEKDRKLRYLLTDHSCPTIVYVSRTKRAEHLAQKLTEEGFPATAYHGQMDRRIRTANQDAFMRGDVNIIVATTAFGMGVDKKDIGMVIHYDISDSLENYVQEAGRAGRDESIRADCYVLYSDEDINKHFNMLNQNRLSQKEIQQVWKALKELTRTRASVSQSALEIARASGWDDSVPDMETRVKTAVNALEQSDFIRRGQNMPRIFADSILVQNMEEARKKIDSSARFDDASRQQAIRIISSLISAKSKARGLDAEGEARVDYLSDRLGIVKADVIRVIGLLREEGILADAKDLVAFIKKTERKNRSKAVLSIHKDVEDFLLSYLDDGEKTYNIKEMNESLQTEFPNASINHLSTLLNYYAIKRFIKRTQEYNKNYVTLTPYFPLSEIQPKIAKRCKVADVIIDYLFSRVAGEPDKQDGEDTAVGFSVLELKEEFNRNLFGNTAETDEIEDALYYLLKIGALKIEGGFLVVYQAMRIERLEKDNRSIYKKEHHAKLEEYYQSKRQQIHIVGEYAKRLIQDYREAMEFVDDYFIMNYDLFLKKYFHGRLQEIQKNITPKKYQQIFGELSPSQREVVEDHVSQYIVVAAGPGSGKTKLLTHKLASLYMMEDVKHEQMLMLTFSRAAATEFKMRLMHLIGNAANFIQITTFHSYCFDLLGKVGDIEKSDQIIHYTVDQINAGDVDLTRLTKTVLVIDEAQDMSAAEFALVKVLMDNNNDLRVIAVGDDDQNIYAFRGSNSAHFMSLSGGDGAKKYELIENYRSCANIVELANQFAKQITNRFKTLPIMPIKKENGTITVCKLASNHVVMPVVNALLDSKPTGTTCIITRTNEEALNITGLLQREGIPARQIQSNHGFNLYDLVELRDFSDAVNADTDGYAINDETWERAKAGLNVKYAASRNLRGVIKLLGDFEATHNKVKYKSDFKQFIRESKLEDFISKTEGNIIVSTIHQTKGREFDNVFLALSRFPKMDDETKRTIYVAITRTKKNLHVYYQGDYFDGIYAESIKTFADAFVYPEPSYICVQLSHKDVYLSFFSGKAKEIDSLVSGQALSVRDAGCYLEDKQVLRFSASFREQIDILKAKGYTPTKATVRHVVFWKGKECDDEIKIVLPDIEFTKQ